MPANLGIAPINRWRAAAARLFFLVLPGLLTLAGSSPGETAGWRATGALVAGRAGHTATLLPNGQVLVAAGGTASGGPVGAGGISSFVTTELYNPATGKWTTTGDLATSGRGSHTATLLNTGKVLVAAGNNGAGPTNSAEIYDPATGFWDAAGSLGVVRQQHAAALLLTGKVLVAGGSNMAMVYGVSRSVGLNSAELYDPGADSWSGAGALAAAREDHTATLWPTARCWWPGGLNGAGYWSAPIQYAELYDPASNTWRTTGSATAVQPAAYRHPVDQRPGAGGRGADTDNVHWTQVTQHEIYDPATGHGIAPVPCPRPAPVTRPPCCPTARCWWPGATNRLNGYMNSAEIYDPATGPGAPPAPAPYGPRRITRPPCCATARCW